MMLNMDTWKIIQQISVASGIISLVFAAFAAVLNYELMALEYSSVPVEITIVVALQVMAPFLLLAIISFAVAWIIVGEGEKIISHENPYATETSTETKPE
jgi:hypothetical protein